MHACDRRTDGQTDERTELRLPIPPSHMLARRGKNPLAYMLLLSVVLAYIVFALSCQHICDLVVVLFAFSCVVAVQQLTRFLGFRNSSQYCVARNLSKRAVQEVTSKILWGVMWRSYDGHYVTVRYDMTIFCVLKYWLAVSFIYRITKNTKTKNTNWSPDEIRNRPHSPRE